MGGYAEINPKNKAGKYDVIVIGGGPAGMMAAVAAAGTGARLLLLEKKNSPGRKMTIAGGGRCNFTNIAGPEAMIDNVPGNGKFLYSALHRYTGEDCREFFNSLGIVSRVEGGGRVFPADCLGADMVSALVRHLHSLGVEIKCGKEVEALILEGNCCLGVAGVDGGKYYGRVVVATGGLSYPGTGSTGKGYQLAATAGHHVTELFPSGVALVCSDDWVGSGRVQGLALSNITVSLNDGERRLASAGGDLLFTHFGVSGPAVLNISRAAAKIFHHKTDQNYTLTILIDMFPDKNIDMLLNELEKAAGIETRKTVKSIMRFFIPDRMVPLVFSIAGIDGEMKASGAGKVVWRRLADTMKQLPLTLAGTCPIREAVVTAGGIDTKEINSRTMESKLVRGLYFAGEVIDVDGYTGGFNMQIAFSTGYLAGLSAALAK